MRCGADRRIASVSMTVNDVKVNRQKRSTTIAACFHSPVSSDLSSSSRIFSVTLLSSPRMASSRLCARQVPVAAAEAVVFMLSWHVQTAVVADVARWSPPVGVLLPL